MKKQFHKLFMGFVCVLALTSTKNAKAEDIPADITSVLAMIEPYIGGSSVPGSGGIPTIPGATLNLGACQPMVVPGFPTTTLTFVPTVTCPVSGNVYLDLVPTGVRVRLEILQGPVEKFEADFTIQIKRKMGTTYVNWQLLNGYVSIRPSQGMPAQAFNMTGAGQKASSKQVTSSKSRVNVFDAATLDGSAIFKESQKVKSASSATTKNTVCSLYDAEKTKVDSGTLVNCRDLK